MILSQMGLHFGRNLLQRAPFPPYKLILGDGRAEHKPDRSTCLFHGEIIFTHILIFCGPWNKYFSGGFSQFVSKYSLQTMGGTGQQVQLQGGSDMGQLQVTLHREITFLKLKNVKRWSVSRSPLLHHRPPIVLGPLSM